MCVFAAERHELLQVEKEKDDFNSLFLTRVGAQAARLPRAYSTKNTPSHPLLAGGNAVIF